MQTKQGVPRVVGQHTTLRQVTSIDLRLEALQELGAQEKRRVDPHLPPEEAWRRGAPTDAPLQLEALVAATKNGPEPCPPHTEPLWQAT